MRKTVLESVSVSGGNKGVSLGTPNIGGGKELKTNVMLSDAEVKKGGNEMLKKDLLSSVAMLVKGGKEMLNNLILLVAAMFNTKGVEEMNVLNLINKVTKGFNKVRELKFYVKNIKVAKEAEKGDLEEYDFDKFPDSVEFDFFSREDFGMAMVGVYCAAVVNSMGFYNFVYDGNFMKLSEPTKAFIYFHELGHIQLGHSNAQVENPEINKEYQRCSRKGEVHIFEYEADFFAAEKVGKWQALSALEEIRASLGPLSKEVMNKRIKAIFLSDLD